MPSLSDAPGRLLRYAARSKRRRRLLGGLLRAIAPILPKRQRPKEPIFILGSPRSGTTLLFEVLKESASLASLGGESHLLWEMFHDPWLDSWRSDARSEETVSEAERRALYWAIDRITLGRRYLDKAPRNSLRVPYLNALFPDARFVYLKRDGRAAVSSMITAWRAPGPMFPGRRLPMPLHINGYEGDTWKFLRPPGWEAYVSGRSLPEVCAFQWTASNEAILAARDGVPQDRWLELSYEELVDSPGRRVAWLLGELGLPLEERVLRHAESLDRHLTKAVTPPSPDKWRSENPRDVEQILPLIEPTMNRLGYAS